LRKSEINQTEFDFTPNVLVNNKEVETELSGNEIGFQHRMEASSVLPPVITSTHPSQAQLQINIDYQSNNLSNHTRSQARLPKIGVRGDFMLHSDMRAQHRVCQYCDKEHSHERHHSPVKVKQVKKKGVLHHRPFKV